MNARSQIIKERFLQGLKVSLGLGPRGKLVRVSG